MTIFSINSGSFGDVTVTGVVSASTLKGDGSQITSVSYENIASKPTLISSSTQVEALLPGGTLSSSAQVDITNTTGYDTFSGSLAAIDTAQTNRLNTIESFTGSYATTGSNTFTGIQTFSDTTNSTSYLDGAIRIAGGMSVRQDVRISGSMTINGLLTAVSMSTQYVTSSQYNVGTSRITLNDDDNVRFAGLSIIDSGSSSPTSASIFWDSLQHRFIYENLSGSNYNSSIIMAGPKHTGTLGDEVGLTDFRVPVAHGSDHIDSRVASSSIRVDFPSRLTHVEAGLYVTGSVTASSGINGGTSTLSSLIVDGDLTVDTTTLKVDSANNRVGIGTAVPDTNLHIVNSNLPAMRMTLGSEARVHNITGVNNGRDLSIRPYRSFDITAGSGTTEGIIDLKAYEYLDVYTGASYTFRARLDANGNLGIGTTNPLAKLHVFHSAVGTGTVSSSSLALQYNSTTTYGRHFMDANGFYVIYAPSEGVSGGNISLWAADTIQFRTAGIVSDPAKMTLNSSGNLGLGVTPSADWASSSYKAFVVRTSFLAGSTAPGTLVLGNNAYNDGAGWKYVATGVASYYVQNAGTHFWSYAASGTAGNAITWTQAMTLDASGNLGIGTTSPHTNHKLHVWLNNATFAHFGFGVTTNTNYSGISLGYSEAAGTYRKTAIVQEQIADGAARGHLHFLVDTANDGNSVVLGDSKMMIHGTNGNVGIGTTNPSTYKLHVNTTGLTGIRIETNGSSFGNPSLAMYNTNTAVDYVVSATDAGAAIGSYSNHSLLFYTNNSQKMVLTAGGNVGIGITNPNAKLEVSGPAGTGGSTLLTLSKLSGWGTTDFFQYYTSATNYGINIGLGVSTATDGRAGITLRGNTITGDGAVIFNTNSTERMQITSLGEVAATHSTTKGPYIRAGNVVTLTNGSTLTLMSGVAGSALITIYETGSGNGGVFFASYSGTITKIAGEGEASDTGGSFAVYKSTNSHTVTLKNRYGISRDFAIGIFSSYAQ